MARYGKAAAKSVKSAMHREKSGTLRSGKGGKGGKVTSRKQAVAIGRIILGRQFASAGAVVGSLSQQTATHDKRSTAKEPPLT